MKHIVIERARKSEFPTGTTESHAHDDEFLDLWKVWEKNQVEDDLMVSEYFDQMEEILDNYAKRQPGYIWNWYTEETEDRK